jgi:hypothetical protein
MKKAIVETFPTYKNEATDDPKLFRVVDRKGDWNTYWHEQYGYMPAVNRIISVGFPKGDGLIEFFKRMTPEEIEHRLNSAGERGSRVHSAIRALIFGSTIGYKDEFENEDGKLAPLTSEEWNFIVTWATWAIKFKPRVLRHETALFHPKFRFAGTADFIGTLLLPAGEKVCVDGKYTTLKEDKLISVLLDWKTSAGIYDDYLLQTSAYAACLKSSPKLPFFTGVVRIGTRHKEGFEMKLFSRSKTKEHFQQFLNSKKTYEWLVGKDWQPFIEQIPVSVSVEVPIIEPLKKGKTNARPRKDR